MIKKTLTQLRQTIATLLIFIMTIEFTGCYTTRIITPNEIDQSAYYEIRCNKARYSVYYVKVSEGVLSGKLDFNNFKSADQNYIYLSTDSLLKINNDEFSVPVNSVTRIEHTNVDQHKTRILTAVIIASVVLIGLTVYLTVAVTQAAEETAEATAQACSDF